MMAKVESFLEALRANTSVHPKMRGVTTAEGLAEIAKDLGLDIPPAAIVKGFAQLLLDSSDTMAVRNFDNLGWDMGELLWAAKTWDQVDRNVPAKFPGVGSKFSQAKRRLNASRNGVPLTFQDKD